MTHPDKAMVERVKAALNTHRVVGIVWPDDAGSCYRVMSGETVFGGDHVDLADAQDACDELNATAALTAIPNPQGSMTNKQAPDEVEVTRLLTEWRAWKVAWLNGLATGLTLACVLYFGWRTFA